ncbi:LOW QUALITY PROTEIN: transcriptional regulator, TetR family [Psychrobacter sp. JCM 18900]|nr:LOW QUALITY PROTEIN: transcriptional regulator, TetR family [Psychrobacter sp. JCM 18900]
MSDNKDEKIEDVLVDSELAKKLVPNKFKFTSQQGRARRQKLLAGAKKIERNACYRYYVSSCVRSGHTKSVCLPFFSLILKQYFHCVFLNAIEILEMVETVDIGNYDRWQGYLTALIDHCITIFHNDETKAKLIYDTNTPDFEGDSFGEDMDHQIVDLVYKRLSERYEMPNFHDIQDTLLIAYSIVNAIFTLSYRRHQSITEEYIQEANTAFIAYLRCYLPEKLPRKNR